MKFNFENLDEQTRQLMSDEINTDISGKKLYPSKYFNDTGARLYPDFLQQAVATGDEETLATVLKQNTCFKDKAERVNKKTGEISLVNVPITANETIAQGEFNRFYIRALCLRAISNEQQLIIYRARHSDNPRPESEIMVGKTIEATKLLNDLRNNIGVETAFGIPGINSGLSVKLV
jgi:hypothetical protein